jgi:UDP-N-acetylglucosamine--N-acetylmuramyl-(pentapeptide) pyrophosphoryl-undecaprenol N-acetylglucosamine transferase
MGLSVVIAGGGTAGHIEPALALADALRRADPDTAITCLGTERGLETRLVPLRGYELALIPPVPLPRKPTPALLAVPARMVAAVSAAASILERTRADVLVGFGGYVSTPAYLAARLRKIPIVVHEANFMPGIANRIGARLTRHVCTGQPGTKLPHARYVGIPIRTQISGLDRPAEAGKARAYFGLQPDLPVLMVTGGSQGAASLNRSTLAAAGGLRAAGIQVLHVVGQKAAEVEVPAGPVPYIVLPYLDRMDLGYAAADFALCRAGAMTCAELTAVGLPAAYVPLPHGNGEQRLNAEPIERAGGGLIVADADLTPEWIMATLPPILHDDARLAAMSQAAAVSGNPRADADLAEIVMSVGWKRPGRRRLPKGQQPSSASRRPAEHGQHPAEHGQHPAEHGQHPAEHGQHPAEDARRSPEGALSPEGRQPGGRAQPSDA